MSAETLRELGYSVIEAGGAREAIRIIEGGARPDLLFTDVVMPECEACWTMCSPGQPGKNGGKGQRPGSRLTKKQGATGITTVAPYVAGQWGRGNNRLPG